MACAVCAVHADAHASPPGAAFGATGIAAKLPSQSRRRRDRRDRRLTESYGLAWEQCRAGTSGTTLASVHGQLSRLELMIAAMVLRDGVTDRMGCRVLRVPGGADEVCSNLGGVSDVDGRAFRGPPPSYPAPELICPSQQAVGPPPFFVPNVSGSLGGVCGGSSGTACAALTAPAAELGAHATSRDRVPDVFTFAAAPVCADGPERASRPAQAAGGDGALPALTTQRPPLPPLHKAHLRPTTRPSAARAAWAAAWAALMMAMWAAHLCAVSELTQTAAAPATSAAQASSAPTSSTIAGTSLALNATLAAGDVGVGGSVDGTLGGGDSVERVTFGVALAVASVTEAAPATNDTAATAVANPPPAALTAGAAEKIHLLIENLVSEVNEAGDPTPYYVTPTANVVSVDGGNGSVVDRAGHPFVNGGNGVACLSGAAEGGGSEAGHGRPGVAAPLSPGEPAASTSAAPPDAVTYVVAPAADAAPAATATSDIAGLADTNPAPAASTGGATVSIDLPIVEFHKAQAPAAHSNAAAAVHAPDVEESLVLIRVIWPRLPIVTQRLLRDCASPGHPAAMMGLLDSLDDVCGVRRGARCRLMERLVGAIDLLMFNLDPEVAGELVASCDPLRSDRASASGGGSGLR